MAFSLPKQQDDSAVSPCHGLGWSHHKQSGGQGSRPCRHHPAPSHHLPQGTTAQGAPLVFCTAAEAERQGANTAKTGGRKNQHISFYPGKETSLCSPKPSTLKLPRLQGGRCCGKGSKAAKGLHRHLHRLQILGRKRARRKEDRIVSQGYLGTIIPSCKAGLFPTIINLQLPNQYRHSGTTGKGGCPCLARAALTRCSPEFSFNPSSPDHRLQLGSYLSLNTSFHEVVWGLWGEKPRLSAVISATCTHCKRPETVQPNNTLQNKTCRTNIAFLKKK